MATLSRNGSAPAAIRAIGPAEAGRRELDERLRALHSSPELARHTDSELRSLLPYVDQIELAAGRRVAAEGRPCGHYVIVAGGRLRAVSGDGQARTLGSGDSWGWPAMWDRSQSEDTVMVETDARLLVMGHAQFRAIKALAAKPLARVGVRWPAPAR